MLVNCFNFSQSFNYAPYLFYKKPFKSEINSFCLWCGVAQLVACWLAVRQTRVRFSSRHHREVFPSEHTCDEEMERGLSEWRWINVLYECDCECMYVIKNTKNKQKEWHHATKPKKILSVYGSCLLIFLLGSFS
jgi:hypothetical protein